ncbi:hypothetical protein [Flavobacterium degerlachei]|jgi:stalled ribosome rescue protein Dom34|uniref:Uncharacterized protein n=1 Tax=Flavobacterium degerlachei TaxID=229203 RepID=A0A1H2UNL3_9FLAO|nr:hypothetical protein [Flavobacterium degerlachei]SDW57124.1 hypothetical protein SAMN05444338_103205 [Flavobacterium degerlachei]
MKKPNQIGIWMDDSIAFLIEFTTKPFEIQTIVSEFVAGGKKSSHLNENESLSSSKATILNKHFSKIGKAILKYNEIVLFGPTEAKLDFFDFLSEDERFLKLKVEIKDADKMNVNQQHDFIKEYFGKDL